MGNALAGLIVIASIVLIWRAATRAKESALRHCIAACQAESVQLLDQSIALRSIRLKVKPRLAFSRTYAFEFSRNGIDREIGLIIIEAKQPVTLYWPRPPPDWEAD